VELLANMLEHIPRRHVGPLHLIEEKKERPPLRDEANVLRHLVEQSIFAAPPRARRRRVPSERRYDVVQLPPRSARRIGETMKRTDERRPHTVGLTHAMLARSPGDKRAAAQAYLGFELSYQRRRARSGLAENSDCSRRTIDRLIQKSDDRP